MSDPHTTRSSSRSRPWNLAIVTLVLTINFTIETVHDLPASSPALWFHLAAALFAAYSFIHNLRTAIRSHQLRQQDRS